MLTTNSVKILALLYRKTCRKNGLTMDEIKSRCKHIEEHDFSTTLTSMEEDKLIMRSGKDGGPFLITGAGELALKHELIYTRSYFLAKVACLAALASLAVSFISLRFR